MKISKLLSILVLFLLINVLNVNAATYYECNKYTVRRGELVRTISSHEWRELYRDYGYLKCPNDSYETANYSQGIDECYVENGNNYDIYKITHTKETYYKTDGNDAMGDLYCQEGKKHLSSCADATTKEQCSAAGCGWNNDTCSESKGGSYSPKTGGEREAKQYDTLDLCASKGVLKVIYFIKVIVNILKVAVPFILIFYISLDVYKMVSDPSNGKKVFPAIKGRLIAAVLVFLIPTLIQVLLSSMGDDNAYSSCYNNAEPPFSNATNK